MPKTFEEIMKENGATEEDIKALSGNQKYRTAIESAYASNEKLAADKAAAEGRVAQYDEWYEKTALPTVADANAKRVTAEADLAAQNARLKKMQDEGLMKVADDQGYKADDQKPKAGDVPAGFDASKYIDRDLFMQTVAKEGQAIAMATEIAQEHFDLFGKRLPMKELHAEAVKLGKSVEELWLTKYGVQAKRDELNKTAEDARIAKIKADAIAEYKSTEANPMTRTPAASLFPSSFRGTKDDATKAPWQSGESRENNRVQKVLTSLNGQQ